MILGLDPGGRRIGVALADERTGLARPLEVIDAAATDPLDRVTRLVTEHSVTLVVVGKPIGLSGAEGPAVDAQRAFVDRLRGGLDVPVAEHDERLTTVVAEQGLRASGASRRARRDRRDAVAAQVMLQGYLDARAGRPT